MIFKINTTHLRPFGMQNIGKTSLVYASETKSHLHVVYEENKSKYFFFNSEITKYGHCG